MQEKYINMKSHHIQNVKEEKRIHLNFRILLIYEFLNNIDKEIRRKKIEHEAQNMFLWALLFNRIEISKILWKAGDV